MNSPSLPLVTCDLSTSGGSEVHSKPAEEQDCGPRHLWWLISSEPFLFTLGQWSFIFRQRSPRSGKDMTQVSATPSCLPWHRSGSCCSGLPVGFLWCDRRGMCWLCERRHCAHCNSFKLRFVQKSHYGLCSCRQLQQESPAHHLSLYFSFHPSPQLGTTAQVQWEEAHADILPGQLMLCPTKVTGKTSATPQTFCTTGGVPEGQAGSEHRWGSYPIPVQTSSR